MSPELLTRIGEYELKEKLGQGGYGAVYKARDSLGRDVAIKVLTAFGDDTTTIEGFKKEATTLARLNHRNIVTVYQFGVDNGKPYLAMEYLQGQPLSALIKSRREMHLVEKLDIIIQATEGLRHAHENKVIHRDIKPHNLMVVENSIVKLIDFGIAQGDGSKSQSRQEIAGSLPYMSPEHFVQKRTPWCDIFSMGVVLYEFLTGGTVPYASDRDDLPVAYHKLMSNDPALPLSSYIKDLPPGLEEVVAKAIAKQKLNGFDSAEEFVFELNRVQDVVKGEFVNHLLTQINQAVDAKEFKAAHDMVERILRVDPNNVPAKRRQFELKKYVQQHHRNEQLHAICVRVEEAISSKKFDLAQLGLEEARQIDPASNTVSMLQQKLIERRELQAQIEVLIEDARRYGSAGNWEPAEQSVDKALGLEASNTRALEFRDAIRRAVAQEARIVEQARIALQELRFQEAFELIRQAEAIAPSSERVNALKELAVNAYKEDERRREVAAATQSAKEFVAKGNFTGAREQLDQAIAKYSDERSLLDLRAEVEKQQEEVARRQFVEEKLRGGEQALKSKNYVDAIAILEQAWRRVPDPRLQELLGKAKEKAQQQAVEKRREQYLKSAKDSMARGDAASAVVTLEMAQSEFGATDQQILSILEEARTAAAREAREAAQREEQARREAERKAHETAEKQEIGIAIANASTQAQQGDFTSALKEIERCATKFGMRPELSTAANEVKATRTANVSAQIETLIDHASAEADAQNYPGALQVLERAKGLTEFASKTATFKLKSAEERIVNSAAAAQSATTIFGKTSSTDAATIVQGGDSATTILSSSSAAAAAPARAPVRDPDATVQVPSTAERRVPTTATRARVEPPIAPPPPSKTKWIAIAAGVLVVALVGALYFVFSPSAVDVRFDTDPNGAVVAVNSEQCTAPCSLKLKTGHYTAKATHDQYSPLDQAIDVTDKTGTIQLKLASAFAPGTGIAPAVGTLMLDINVDGADIFVDNQLKDTARGKKDKISVAAGSHQVRVEKQGYQPVTQPVDIAKDSQASLSFTLEKGASTGPVQAYVIVTSVPNAKVLIDKQQVGTVQADGTYSGPVEAGKRHSLEVSLDGYEPMSKTFTAKDGERLREAASLKPLKPAVLSFSADASEIQAGKSTVLKWDTKNATDVSIDNGVGSVQPSGSRQVNPNATTKFNLIAKNAAGQSVAQKVTVKVNAAAVAAVTPPPTPAPSVAKPVIARFELGTDSIVEGKTAKLMWDTQNADGVTIDPDVGPQKASGSATISPSKTTTYTLTAKGPGGTVTSQPQTLTVEAKAAPAPTPTAPAPTTSAGSDDAQLIKQVLEQRWPAAFMGGNTGDIKAIYPNIPKSLLDAIKGAKGMTLAVNGCSPQVSGDKATARCNQVATYGGKSTPGSVSFALSKSGGSWLIQSSK